MSNQPAQLNLLDLSLLHESHELECKQEKVMKQLINTETEYQDALEMREALMLLNPEEGSVEADELNLLVYLIASYERHTTD